MNNAIYGDKRCKEKLSGTCDTTENSAIDKVYGKLQSILNMNIYEVIYSSECKTAAHTADSMKDYREKI